MQVAECFGVYDHSTLESPGFRRAKKAVLLLHSRVMRSLVTSTALQFMQKIVCSALCGPLTPRWSRRVGLRDAMVREWHGQKAQNVCFVQCQTALGPRLIALCGHEVLQPVDQVLYSSALYR